MNSTIYKQYNSPWASKPYPTKSSSFAGNGCGCCACTHLIIEQNKYKKTTPEPIRKYMVSQGFAVVNQGTTWSGITKTLQHYGYNVKHIGVNDPMSQAWKELDKGNRIGIILFLGGAGPDGTVWTAGGHYIAFTDYKKSGSNHKMFMKDSGGRNHDGWYTYEKSMKGRVYQMWIVEKLDPDSKVITDDYLNKSDIKKAQKAFGTTVDGKISGQLTSSARYWSAIDLDCIDFGSGGSSLIKAIQKKLKLSGVDGYLGPNTIKAIQKKCGATVDGDWGIHTTKAFNKWVNSLLENQDKAPTSTSTTSSTKPSTSSSKKVKLSGIDISAYQGKVSTASFKKMKKEGLDYVILRVGYTGSDSNKPTIDKVFEHNYKTALAAGLPIGIYYYSLARTESKAKEEAKFCIEKLKGKKITYPVYIDVEDSKQYKCTKTELANVCNAFCKTISNSSKYTPGVYANLNWFNDKIGKITASHTKWVAQYNSKCEYKGAYDMWQYTSSGKMPGISGNVDKNYCYKKFGE